MTIKNMFYRGLFSLCCLLCVTPVIAQTALPIGQTLQIKTYLNKIKNNPSWLLVIRDVETGQVLPYIFDFRQRTNTWAAFTLSHSYRVTASELTFRSHHTINNFCHLEDGIISGKSLFITLSGRLTPSLTGLTCQVLKYPNLPLE